MKYVNIVGVFRIIIKTKNIKMNLHWEWIPLIITIGSFITAYIIEGHGESGPITFLTGIITVFSFIIYIILGIIWLYNHINII